MGIWLRRTCHLGHKKSAQKRRKEAKEQLVIDKATMKDSKARLTNLTMGCIDYRKAYDMVTHTWIHECLEMYKVDEKMRHMMRNSMKTWRTVLECNGSELGEVDIRKVSFKVIAFRHFSLL